MRTLLRACLLAVIATVSMLAAVPSTPAAVWSPVVKVASSEKELTPQVTLLAGGRVAVGLPAFRAFGMTVARLGSPFPVPDWIRLTPPNRSGAGALPLLHDADIARDGTAVVLYAAHLRVTRERRIFLRPDGAQPVPRSISTDGHSAGAWDGSADLAIAADGTAVAAWARHTGAHWQVQVATMDRQGNFTAPVTINSPNPIVDDITVAAAPGRNGFVAWRSLPNDSDQAFFFEGRFEGVPVTRGIVGDRLGISGGPSAMISDLRVAEGRDGTSAVSWTDQSAETSTLAVLHLATLTPDGTLERAIVTQMPLAAGYGPPATIVDATGAVTVAWLSAENSSIPRASAQVMYATRPRGGMLTAPQIVSRPDEFPVALTLVGRDDGAALLAWSRLPEFGMTRAMAAAVRLPGETFGRPIDVFAWHGGLAAPPAPTADLAPDGRLAMVWQEQDRSTMPILLVTGALR